MARVKRIAIAVVVACGTVLATSQIVADAVVPRG
jgi:galactitol-specific phosphotransferase system IIB component